MFRIFKNLFTSNCCSSVDIVVDSPASSPVGTQHRPSPKVDARGESGACSALPCLEEYMPPSPVRFTVQSGEIVKDDSHNDEVHIKQETVQFLDESPGQFAGFRYVDGLQHSDTTTDVGLAKFLSRPVKISSLTWAESDLPGTLLTINPWHLFFNNSYVKNKIANFAFVRCNLKVKVIINASPFYYGAMLASYQPLPALTPDTISAGVGLSYFIPLSQRPHFWIYPANSEGGEITLPFFWHKNWLCTQVAQDFTDMGQMKFTAFTTLDSANGVTGQGVTMQIYAWAEDVELSGPSVGLTMQTDEYGDGVISKPASAVAEAMGKLARVPGIGRFATAAQIGASAVSRITSLFGFSNPPVISNVQPFRPTAFPQMSNVETCFPGEKLAMDPKNELSVDPGIVGLPSVDELDIQRLVQRESYICDFAWTTVKNADDILFSSYVAPDFYGAESATNEVAYYPTPLKYVSRLFQSWRGDIIFRFKVVCSQYHKGRLRISWDPRGTSGSSIYDVADTNNIVQTAIIDIGKDTDVEFRVPYHQAYPWLLTQGGFSTSGVLWSESATPTWNADPLYENGAITLRVLTKLTAPVGTSSAYILVFVRGAENLEFANPGYAKDNLSFFTTQTDETAGQGIEGESPQHLVAGTTDAVPRERYLVNFGEKISTLRSLLHRHYFSRTLQGTVATTGDNQILTSTFYKLPLNYGYDPNGINTAKGLNVPATDFPFNYATNNPINWILAPFVGVRGSMVWTFNATNISQAGLHHVRVCRVPYDRSSGAIATTWTTSNQTSTNDTAYRRLTLIDCGTGGSALTAQRTQFGLSVVCPQYTNSKFTTTHARFRATDNSAYDLQVMDKYKLEIVGTSSGSNKDFNNTQIEWYCAGGTDLTPLFFLNVPTVFVYGSTPAP